MQGTDRLIRDLLGDQAGNPDLAGRDGLDVDFLVGEQPEHPGSHSRMTAHPGAHDGDLRHPFV